MRTRDREAHGGVIEGCGLPRGRAVTVLTGLREGQRNVIRVGCFAELCHMAPSTGGGGPLVLTAQVATRAIERGVRSGEGVARDFQMVEAGA